MLRELLAGIVLAFLAAGCSRPEPPVLPRVARSILITDARSGAKGELPLSEWNPVLRALGDCRWESGWFSVFEPELTIEVQGSPGRTVRVHLAGSEVNGGVEHGYSRCRLSEARADELRRACLRALR